jgi:hypothetical protein
VPEDGSRGAGHDIALEDVDIGAYVQCDTFRSGKQWRREESYRRWCFSPS